MMILHLEDRGQDFLRFTVDDHGVIVEAAPSQGWVWEGKTIINRRPRRNSIITFLDGSSLAYPVVRVERVLKGRGGRD